MLPSPEWAIYLEIQGPGGGVRGVKTVEFQLQQIYLVLIRILLSF